MADPARTIVDCHTHLVGPGEWPDEWWQHVATEWAEREPGRSPSDVFLRIEPGLIDVDGTGMVAAMDEAGVDASVLLPWDWGPDFTTHVSFEAMNARTARLAARHPTRFVPFYGVDPRRPGAADHFGAALERREAFGLKLYPSCGFDVRDAAALYQRCVDHDVPVLVHTGDPLPLLPVEQSHPAHLADVIRDFPRLRLWLGHAGATSSWDDALRTAAASELACLELSAWLWDDATDDAVREMVRRIVEAKQVLGVDRLLFGSDHVSGTRVRGQSFMRVILQHFQSMVGVAEGLALDLDDGDLAKILGANATRELHRWSRGPE